MVSFLFFGGKVQHRKIFDGLQYFLLMVRFCVLERQIFRFVSADSNFKLFFEQFLKLQRRRDVVNLMPKKLIVVASNFFSVKKQQFFDVFSGSVKGEIFFFNHKMICIRDR